MPYGTIKVDNITFTNGGSDSTITVSGIVEAISGNITATGTIQGATIIGTSTVSGATVTGNTASFTSGTFVSGIFTTQISGATITGNTGNFTTFNAGTANLTSGVFASGTQGAPSLSIGTTTNGLYSPGADQVAISTGGSGKLFVNNAGEVDVSSANARLYITTTGANTAVATLRNASYYYNINLDGANGGLTFYNGTERLRITAAGLVGIGTPTVTPVKGGTALEILNATGSEVIIGSSDTTATAGDFIGAVVFRNSDLGGTPNHYAGMWAKATNDSGSVDLRFASGRDLYEADTPQMTLNANGLGIGTTSAETLLHLRSDSASAVDHLFLQNATGGAGSESRIAFSASTAGYSANRFSYIGATLTGAGQNGHNLVFATNANGGSATEKARIDSSGRLLVGTPTDSAPGAWQSKVQVASTGFDASISLRRDTNSASGPVLAFGKSRGSLNGVTVVSDNDQLGSIFFYGADNTDLETAAASIVAAVDGTPGANDMPGRLVFSTTADGASSPTERMRITSTGQVRLAGAGITFNGDTATANELDDYEEGTWTPQLEFGGATTGITYNARQGYYVKIGKMVFITVYFNLSSKGTATGNSTVTGLPFTSEDFNVSGTTSWPGSKAARKQNQTGADFAMAVQDNTATIGISDGAGSALTDTTYTNGTIIECALRYRAAS